MTDVLCVPQVNGTIWTELDESKLYASMELEVVDKLFCAYQKNGVPVSKKLVLRPVGTLVTTKVYFS